MRRAVTAAAAVAAALAGCGGDDPEAVMSETAKKLRDLRSGELTMRMDVAAGGGGNVGFALRGPFELPARGGLPRARLAYTQIAGARRATVTITSTGRRAFVTANGRTRALEPAQARRLRVGPGGAGEQLTIGDWVRDPKVQEGPELDDVETQRVTAGLDVRAAAGDLLRVAGALGPGTESLGSAGDLERAVRSSSFELVTGKEDRQMRRLRIGMRLESGGRRASVTFLAEVRRPNRPVRIAAPG